MNNLLQKIQQQQQEQQQYAHYIPHPVPLAEQQPPRVQAAGYTPHPVPHPQPYQPHQSQLNDLYEPEEQNSYRAKQTLIREYRKKMKRLQRETAP
ncbi:splicing factor 3B subunit 4-like [Osmia bicornis bicornis]|uniref:splicing factor 3B subunit 4-like n=1 Tax=Osmia bicornis bicornis TaxID=1437191 RepID=UPI001EAF1037|nr:splicing factor 3B subunit 4-like [Osmia bicornis bicornis]